MARSLAIWRAGFLISVIGLPSAELAAAAADRGDTHDARTAQSRPVTATFRDMRASKLIGSEVTDAEGGSVGEIQDLIVDVNNDRVYYAVLSLGGVLGLGDKRFAYPARMFKQASEGDKLVLNASKAKLESLQGVGRKRQSASMKRYDPEVDPYVDKAGDVRLPNQVLRRASEVIGRHVDSSDGEELGAIADVVVNIGKGTVHYAVFEFDQSWNVNNKTVLVPLRAFDFSSANEDAVLRVDKTDLRNALTFDKHRWPLINNPIFLVEVDRYLVLIDPKRSGKAGNAEAVFHRLDVNRDNKLSAVEARQDSKVLGAWRRLDAKRKGTITRAEFMAKYKAVVD